MASKASMMRFVGKVAVVTGGAQGIGLGVAQRLQSEGATVVLVDMSAPQLEAASTLASNWVAEQPKPEFSALDVTDGKAVEECFKGVFTKHGRLDILVQAAGIVGATNVKTADVNPEDFARVMNINVNGIFLCCRAAIPHMLANDYGRIVNIASISGKDGNAGMLAYSTSKAAVIGLTKAMGKEYAETNLTINCIAPAVVKTAMVAAMPAEQVKYMTDKIPMKRTGTIEEVTATIAFIASDEASFTTGFCFDASGGRAVY